MVRRPYIWVAGAKKGRRGFFTAATFVENPASCSTRPMNDLNSKMLVGRGNCDTAFNLSSSMVTPPCFISYPFHDRRSRAKRNFSLLNVIPAPRAAWRTTQTPAKCAGNERSKRRRSSAARTVFNTAAKAASALLLYSSPEQLGPMDAWRN